MIVGEPNEFGADIHDRMAVFLTHVPTPAWLASDPPNAFAVG
jgi:putative SOS response-associated peptidase YedK